MIKSYIFNLIGKHRSEKYDFHLGVMLAFVAGVINAGGFLYVGQYTSHMTGIASSVADFLVLAQFHLAVLALFFLASFVLGAATTAILINWAKKHHHHSEFVAPLLMEAILLLVFALFTIDNLAIESFKPLIICLLCFVMGLQNAIITKISNARIRTTHVTGLSTDIGIQIGKIIYRFLGKNKAVNVEYKNLRLHSALLFSFCLGGIIGALMFKYIGFLSITPFAIFLITISLVVIVEKN